MISSQDIVVVLFLIFLEGILSIDNALVLAMLARKLPKEQQRKALTYGLVGAVVFRLISLAMVTYLIQWRWVKFVGGGYLLYLSIKHFLFGEKHEDPSKPAKSQNFWRVVVAVELTDIAFAVDSILAAVALSNKFWVVFTGGVLGVIMMRFAATIFLKLLDKFPNFETTAYLLVFVIGVKVILEGLSLPGIDFHSASAPSFWIFWAIMASCVAYGFKGGKKSAHLKQTEKAVSKIPN
jgi:YkoY family integral membrane protein